MEIRLHLFGSLEQDRFRRGPAVAGDGGVPIALAEGSTVTKVIAGGRFLPARVSRVQVNGRDCTLDTPISCGDLLVLLPDDFVALRLTGSGALCQARRP